jgi:hypothetical protein
MRTSTGPNSGHGVAYGGLGHDVETMVGGPIGGHDFDLAALMDQLAMDD